MFIPRHNATGGNHKLAVGLGMADTVRKSSFSFTDDDGQLHGNLLPRTLLLMHRWYVTSAELAGKLLMIYPIAAVTCLHNAVLCSDFISSAVIHLYWIVTFPAEFNLDLGLIQIMEEFREAATQLGCEAHFKLIDISAIPSYDWMRKLTQRKKQAKKGKASLLFDHLEPVELAEHLTFLEFKFIRRISVRQPVHIQLKPLMVLRGQMSSFFLLFSQKLLHLQNFNTLMAVVGGLSHSSISRLKETHAYLAPEVLKMWNEMTELVSSNNNYSNYRKAFSECRGFKIPILGVHLKDLIAVHVVFPDWVGDGSLVNLVKMHQLYMTFNELVSLQGLVSHVEPNMDLIYLLTLSLDLYYTEDEIYELSLLREPRSLKSQPTSPTTPNKPLAPLDWASGVTTKPDPSVVNKHIRKLVESVFRNYDHDHDGYISQEDFESIAANFPFLESFCVLDKDQLLRLSRFLGVFSNLLLYFCFRMQLWGIIKQGYKCKDCGVNCHKQCRELLVLACRKQTRTCSLSSDAPARLTHSSLPNSPTLPTYEDDVFEFPAVPFAGQPAEPQSITLMTGSAQRISVCLQRATTNQATQTEPLWPELSWGCADSGSHTFPKMKYRTHRKASKNVGFASWENHNDRQQPGASPQSNGDYHQRDRKEGEEKKRIKTTGRDKAIETEKNARNELQKRLKNRSFGFFFQF
uniref:RAS guanyl releasing protein 3 (calcium and DAG-regulated) n=1 Tax=Cyprinodon variegatus TaxID=28743 RepID=A0A3Q2D7Q5_CYPVA